MILPKPVILLLCPHFIYWISHQANYVNWRDLFTRTDRALAMISVNQSVSVCVRLLLIIVFILREAHIPKKGLFGLLLLLFLFFAKFILRLVRQQVKPLPDYF